MTGLAGLSSERVRAMYGNYRRSAERSHDPRVKTASQFEREMRAGTIIVTHGDEAGGSGWYQLGVEKIHKKREGPYLSVLYLVGHGISRQGVHLMVGVLLCEAFDWAEANDGEPDDVSLFIGGRPGWYRVLRRFGLPFEKRGDGIWITYEAAAEWYLQQEEKVLH